MIARQTVLITFDCEGFKETFSISDHFLKAIFNDSGSAWIECVFAQLEAKAAEGGAA